MKRLLSLCISSWILSVFIITTFATGRVDGRQRREHKDWLKTVEQKAPKKFPNPSEGVSREDICSGWWCGLGRECRPGKDSLPNCVCRQHCPVGKPQLSTNFDLKDLFNFEKVEFDPSDADYLHHGPVCGSDGIIYPTECELHRTGCLTGNQLLTVDNDPNSCRRGGQGPKGGKDDGVSDDDDNEEDEDGIQMGTNKSPGFRPQSTPDLANDMMEHHNPKTPNDPDSTLDSVDDDDYEEDDDDSIDYSSLEEFKSKSGLKSGKGFEKSPPGKVPTTTTTASTTHKSISKSIKSNSGGEKIKRGSSLCSPEEYEILKDALLVYNHEHLVISKGKSVERDNLEINPKADEEELNGLVNTGLKIDKSDLLSLMFAHFDHDHNGALDYGELQKIGYEEQLGRPALRCHPVDFFRFDDMNHDNLLTPDEFYTAFNKLYSMKVVKVSRPLDVIHVTGKVGQSVEIRCSLTVPSEGSEVIWSRYGVQLSTKGADKLSIFPQGILLITAADLLHAGNFTCHHKENPQLVQPYRLSIQTEPEVKVRPHMVVWEKPGGSVELECRVRGEPEPKVTWLKNEIPLATEDMRDKYQVQGDGITLSVQEINVSDTGAYMCQVERNETQFLILHQRGISAYDPTNCRLQHQILSTDIIPGTQNDFVCGSSTCEWGKGIRVSSRYVYVSQPTLHRLLVISISQMVVVDVILTDPYPVGLHYVPHVDQVWVECWRNSEDSEKSLQVVRNAKEKRKHRAIRIKPWKAEAPVHNVFLPSDLPSSGQFSYAYITRKSARGLYKVDLRTLRYVKSIDLSSYNCLPKRIHFSSLYGFMIVECREPVLGRPTGQLVLDALSDAVIGYKEDLHGHSFLSPDSRKLVTLVSEPEGTTLLLQLVQENGLQFSFDVSSSLNLSDIAFFPSQRFHSYDLYASAVDDDHVFFLDLQSGRVELVPGAGRSPEHKSWKRPLRPIKSQDIFGKYLVSPSREAVFVINGRSHTVNCEVGGMQRPSNIVWLQT